MSEELQPKQIDTIAKIESLLEAPMFTKLLAFAFYAEFVLRHFYGISFGDFSTFAALRDFAVSIKPISLVFIMAGAIVFPRVGLAVWRVLQQLLFNPIYYFRREQRETYERLAAQGEVIRVNRAKRLARKKKDDYLLKECEELEEGARKNNVTKINVAAIFTITALNLICNYYGHADAGLIMHSMAAQLTWLLVTGIYAGIDLPEHYDWVLVPDDYTEDEIRSTRFQRSSTPPVVTGKEGNERFLSAREELIPSCITD